MGVREQSSQVCSTGLIWDLGEQCLLPSPHPRLPLAQLHQPLGQRGAHEGDPFPVRTVLPPAQSW